jgi:hypothetical protein
MQHLCIVGDCVHCFNKKIEADSDFGNFKCLIFINDKADSNVSQFLSSILQPNKMRGASHLVANEHKGLFDSESLSNNDFRLVVNSKLILHSEGEHTTKPNGLVNCNNLVYFDNHIGLVGPIELVELIGHVGHTNNFVGPSQLIVKSKYSKISLHFCKDCRIFCEGEWKKRIIKKDGKAIINAINRNNLPLLAFGRNLAFGLSMAFGRNLAFSLNLAFGLIMAFGLTMAFGLNNFVKRILVGQISLVSLSGISSISGRIDHNGLIGLICLSLVSLVGLVGHIGFRFVSLIGLGNLSIISLINIIGQTGLIGPSASSARQLVSLIGFIGLVGLVSFGLISLILIGKGIIVNSLQFGIEMKQSQHDLFQRESWSWCVGRVFSSLAGLNSVFGNALQNATQLFFDRILQVTKYCVMRECENIHSWISLSGDLAFSHQDGIYDLNFPKGFWRSLPEISLFCQS